MSVIQAAQHIDPSEQYDSVTNAEATLWRAVISQAINDGISNHRSDLNRGARESAREWFRRRGQQYRYVCDLAGYNPDWLAAKVQQLFEKADNGTLSTPAPPATPSREFKRYSYNGKSLTLSEWATETGIDSRTLRSRITYLSWPIERALTEPTNLERSRRCNRRINAPGVSPDLPMSQGTGGGCGPFHEKVSGDFVQDD
jgi:hypothetical protein